MSTKRIFYFVLFVFLFSTLGIGVYAQDEEPWRDPELPSMERAEALLAVMSTEDKINMVTGNIPPIAQYGLPLLERVDASSGLRGDTGVTAFPVPMALGATFNTELAYDYGVAVGIEAREHGWGVVLGPTVDIDRTSLSGRQTESYGEDPLLSGLIGANMAAGVQSQDLITSMKHYTVYNQETARDDVNLVVSERALHEIYNMPFYLAINEGNALSVMCAYPRVNGTHACENEELLSMIREQTGWNGFYVSDFGAGEDYVAGFNAGVDSTTLWPWFDTTAFTDGRISEERLTEATRYYLYAIFESGLYDNPAPELNQELDVRTPERDALATTVAEESIVLLKNNGVLPLSSESIESVAVIGPSGTDVVTGVEGSTYVTPGEFVTPLDAISELAGEEISVVAAQGSYGDFPRTIIPSIVLTTPSGTTSGLLGTFYDNLDFSGEPFTTQVMETIDLSGKPISTLPNAWSARWTGTLTPTTTGPVIFSALGTGDIQVIIDGEPVISGTRTSVNFVTGAYNYPLLGVIELTADAPVDIVIEFSTTGGGFFGPTFKVGWQAEQLIGEAVAAAEQSDVAVVFVNQATGEGMDRDSFDLTGDQNMLIEAVSAVNPNTVVVLNTPGPVFMPWLNDVAGVVQIWYPGQAVGTGTANVLFGEADPSGRLPVTFPADSTQGPVIYESGEDFVLEEDIFVGYRFYQENDQTPLFPFGYGLSYAEFEYSELEIAGFDSETNVATVQFTITNTSERSGTEVAQVYVGELPADVAFAPRQLAGFTKVTLEPGTSETVEVELAAHVFSYWDEDTATWVTTEGDVTIYVGRSAADEQLSVTLTIE